MEYPTDRKYSAEHEWVDRQRRHARVGITDYAQDALGDIVFVQVPDVGLEVVAGSSCAEVEFDEVGVGDLLASVGRGQRGERGARRASRSGSNRTPTAKGGSSRSRMADPASSPRSSTPPRTSTSWSRPDRARSLKPLGVVGTLGTMRCARCGHENEAPANFCSSCGASLGDVDETTASLGLLEDRQELEAQLGDLLSELPADTGILVVRRGPNAGSTLRPRDRQHEHRPPPRLGPVPRRRDRVAAPRGDRARLDGATRSPTSGRSTGRTSTGSGSTPCRSSDMDEVQIGRFVLAFLLGGRPARPRRRERLVSRRRPAPLDRGGAHPLHDEFPDVTVSKIRFLESQGLIDPERTPSGYRRFYAARPRAAPLDPVPAARPLPAPASDQGTPRPVRLAGRAAARGPKRRPARECPTTSRSPPGGSSTSTPS